MKFVLRWTANSIAFFLGLYLVDSLIAPRFFVQAVWVAVVLAIVLGLFNSMVRPLHKVKTRPRRAIIAVVLTLLLNTLMLQIFVWAGASLAATSLVWVLVTGAFLSVLGGVINWLIGFRSKNKPGATTREKTAGAQAAERGTKPARTRS